MKELREMIESHYMIYNQEELPLKNLMLQRDYDTRQDKNEFFTFYTALNRVKFISDLEKDNEEIFTNYLYLVYHTKKIRDMHKSKELCHNDVCRIIRNFTNGTNAFLKQLGYLTK